MAVPVSSATPIVFLDIDGVLLPFGRRSAAPRRKPRRFPGRVPRRLARPRGGAECAARAVVDLALLAGRRCTSAAISTLAAAQGRALPLDDEQGEPQPPPVGDCGVAARRRGPRRRHVGRAGDEELLDGSAPPPPRLVCNHVVKTQATLGSPRACRSRDRAAARRAGAAADGGGEAAAAAPPTRWHRSRCEYRGRPLVLVLMLLRRTCSAPSSRVARAGRGAVEISRTSPSTPLRPRRCRRRPP